MPMWAVATGLFFLANADGFGTTSVAAAFVAAIGFLALAYRDDGVDDVIAPAGVLAAMLLASWNLPHVIPEMNLWVFRLQPDHIADFMTAAALFVAMGGAVRRSAAGIGHRLLVAAEIRCRYRLDLDRAGAGRDRTRRRLLGRAAAQRASRNAARPRDRNRPRRLCGRRARQHDRRRHPGARRGLADRCLGIAPAGARLDRRPLPIAGAALAGA